MQDRLRFGWILVMLVACASVVGAGTLPVQPIPADRVQTALTADNQTIGTTPEFGRAARSIVAEPLMVRHGSSPAAAGQLDLFSSTFERDGARDFLTTPLGPQHNMRYLSFGGDRRNPLDLPACSLVTAPNTTLSYFSGIQAGDAYKVWFNPANCAGCSPVYPFRVDSLRFQLVQADSGAIDTVTIGIDIECAAFDPTDPCNGPGPERCLALFSIALPADSINGFLTVYDVVLPLDSCWVDGPFFAGIYHLGHTDAAHFHPNAALDGGAQPPVTPCTAWANLSGSYQQWADVWVDPDPGYPVMTLYGECNASNPGPIVPCPVLCNQQRIGGAIAFYDPTSTAVWEWIPAGPDISFPYKPQQMDFSLYYPNAGSADDSVTVQITYGCQRLNDICCAPSDVLCAGQITLVRGNPAGPYQLPVSLDLSAMTCCLPDHFWVGAQIVAVGVGDAIPSFLWSSTTTDPNPVPECEQWIYSSGAFEHWPQGSESWWDAIIAGTCGDCGGDPVDQCTTVGAENLNCTGATPIACSSEGTTLTNQTNSGGNSDVTEYCCVPWDESGPEKVYSVSVPNNGNLIIDLTNVTGGDVDVMLLSSCNRMSCVAGGDVSVSASGLAAGTYYIVVDGFNGDIATYSITVTCLASCSAIICRDGLNPGTPNTNSRYIDGEWSVASGDTVYYTYMPNVTVGTVHYILKWSAATCDTFRRVQWTAAQAAAADRGLAYDPRNGGNFWTSTWLAPNAGRLYRVSATGTVLNTFTSIAGIDTFILSGMAFDPDHNHLWVFRRGTALYAPSRAYEIDVTNPASPVLIQGPHVLAFQYPDSIASSGGADYAEAADKILLAGQGTPVDFIQCFTDIDPAYAGPPPGPGLMPVAWCPPDSNYLQGFGLAAIDNGGDGTGAVQMLNFTDGNFQPHRIFEYPSPCVLTAPCDPVADLTVIRVGANITVRGTAPQAGNVQIYSTAIKNNNGDPVGNPDFILEATIPVTAGQVFAWNDPAGVGPTYRNYVAVMNCQ